MSTDDFANVVELPSPEQRARAANDTFERERIVKVISAQADGWRSEVKRWLEESDPKRTQVAGLAEHYREPMARVVKRYLTPGQKPEVVSTGFPDLDDLFSLEPGSLVTIAARSGRGKSSLAFQLSMHVAGKTKGTSLYFSSEMPAEQLMMRGACQIAGVDSKKFRRGTLDPGEFHLLGDACNEINASLAWIVDDAGLDILRIRQAARHEARRLEQETGRPLKLVVVDYLQRVKPGKAAAHNANREQQVAAVALELKEMAMELGVCVVAPAQLNADADGRKDDRPMASDLRESKGIENESDVVLIIHNRDYMKRQMEPGRDLSLAETCDIVLAKGRSDGTGIAPLWFTPKFSRFTSMSRDEKDTWAAAKMEKRTK